MDPDATLIEMRDLASRIFRHDGEGMSTLLAESERLAELVQAMDTWLCNGGYPPISWSHERRTATGQGHPA